MREPNKVAPQPTVAAADQQNDDDDETTRPLQQPSQSGNHPPSQQECEKQKRHRIAMVCDFFHPRLGGVENHIYSLSQHLLQQGHKVIVITHAYRKDKNTKIKNKNDDNDVFRGVRYYESASKIPLKVYYCPILPMVDQDSLPTFTATFPLLRWILKRERIGIVHAHQATSTLANESIVYASLLGIPSVYTDHSLFGFHDLAGIVLNRVQQATLCTTRVQIAVSHACRDNLVLRTQCRGLTDPPKVVCIPNAVDPNKFPPDPTQRPSNGRINVVVVSRLVYRKGVDLLVGIIPEICRLLPQVDFVVGGDGAKLLPLQEVVERERLEDRVTFLGSVPHQQVRNVLVQGHVFLNCSLTESFCIAILEAACAGLLVVSTNVGGIPEVLPPDMVRLANPNVPDMVHQLRVAVEKQQAAPVDPWEQHKRVRQLYSWDRVAVETLRVYDSISDNDLARKDDPKTLTYLGKRMTCYYRAMNGGVGGIVVAFLAVILRIWQFVVDHWQPESMIDIMPDLIEQSESKKESRSSCRLTDEQIQAFLRDGVLVVDNLLSKDDLKQARQGLSTTLAKVGVACQRLEQTGNNLQKLSSTNGSGGVLDVFYEDWKLHIATSECLLEWTQQLWRAAYCFRGEKEEQITGGEEWKWHPFGAFDPCGAYCYIDRIGFRIPTLLAEELGQNVPNSKKKTKKLPLQRGLTPHLDCCPDTYNDQEGKSKWRPIQCFVSLTDNLEANTGGFEAAKGFHKEFHEWAKNRPPTILQKKGSPDLVSFPAPCVGEYTHIRPKEDHAVMQQVHHVPVRAGSVVFWDNRIPHANAYRHVGSHPRAVVYCSFLPDVAINRIYVQEQLKKWQNGKSPTDQWVEDRAEDSYRGESFEAILPTLSLLQRQLLGIDPWPCSRDASTPT